MVDREPLTLLAAGPRQRHRPATVVAGSTMFPRDRVIQSLQKYAIPFADSETTEELRGKLAEFYAQRTTTGHIIPVDGGLSDAFLR